MTVAQLGFAIDSSDAAGAAADLDKLTSSAAKAEQAAGKTGAAGTRMSQAFGNLSPSLDKIVASLGRLETTTLSIDKRLEAMSRSAGKATAANKNLDASVVETSAAYKQLEASLNAVQAAQRKGDLSLQQSVAMIDKQKAAIAALNAELKKLQNTPMPGAGPGPGPRQPRTPSNNNNSQFNNSNIAAQLFDIGSTAPFMNPATIALQQGPQLAQALGGQSIKGAIAGLGAGLATIVSPLSLAAIGLTAGAAAAIQFGIGLANSGEETKKLDDVLEDHENVLGRLEKAYGSLIEGAKNYGRESKSLLGSVSRTNATALTSVRRTQASEFFDSVGTEYAGNIRGQGDFFASSKYEAFQTSLATLRAGIKAGNADFDVFYRRVAEIGSASPELQKIGDEMIVNASKIEDANKALEETLRLQKAIAAGQRGFLINSPGQDAANDYETEQRLSLGRGRSAYDAQIAGLGARSPAERAAAARRAEEARFVSGESGPEAKQRIELAGNLALAQAEQQLADAQRDRAANLDRIVKDQQSEVDLIGKTGGAAVALRKEYELTSQLRMEAARQGIEVDQKELDLIKQRSEELGKLTNQYNQRSFDFDMGRKARESNLTSEEREITQSLRGYGLPEDLKGANAGLIRQDMEREKNRAAIGGFLTDFRDGVLKNGGDIGKAMGDAVKNALLNALTKASDQAIERLTNSIVSAVFGGGPTSQSAAATGGGILGTALGAANDNKTFAAPVGAVTRAPLGDIASSAASIRKIESGSFEGNYGALGPVTRNGDRAYGAYQVMGNNVGPWSKEALGKSMTASEFLTDKGAQDAVFKHKFGGYTEKYGASGAAQAWFGGPGSVGKGGRGADILGTSGNAYVEKFETNVSKLTDATGAAAKGVGGLGQTLASIPQALMAGGGGSGILSGLTKYGMGLFSGSAQFANAWSKGGIGLYANGTDYAPGGMAMVGERGPELVNLPQGSGVVSNHKLMSALAANNNSGQGRDNLGIRLFVEKDGNWNAKVVSLAKGPAKQASAQAVGQYSKQQTRGGFGDTQSVYASDKG